MDRPQDRAPGTRAQQGGGDRHARYGRSADQHRGDRPALSPGFPSAVARGRDPTGLRPLLIPCRWSLAGLAFVSYKRRIDTLVDSAEARIARRIQLERISRGWSLADLAEKSGVAKASISKIERGEVSPSAGILVRIAAAFDLT